MTMIDYYLLGARVSFCVCKNSCHVVQKLPCCLSGSSLSSDIATQVTCIVIAQCSSKFSSSDVVTCFLLPGGLVFSFPTHSFSLVSLPFFDTSVSGTSVPGQVSAKFSSQSLLKFLLRHISSSTRLFHNVSMPNPQPKSAAVGMSITANSPLSKRKESALACKGSLLMVCCTSYMAASVGPKAQ